MENRVVGDLLKLAGAEKKVAVPRTTVIAWQHIGYRQAPYQRYEGCFASRKKLFFVLFAQQGPPGGSTVPLGVTFHFWALGATTFFWFAGVRKIAFPSSLTV